jgi:hypothetical protein
MATKPAMPLLLADARSLVFRKIPESRRFPSSFIGDAGFGQAQKQEQRRNTKQPQAAFHDKFQNRALRDGGVSIH